MEKIDLKKLLSIEAVANDGDCGPSHSCGGGGR